MNRNRPEVGLRKRQTGVCQNRYPASPTPQQPGGTRKEDQEGGPERRTRKEDQEGERAEEEVCWWKIPHERKRREESEPGESESGHVWVCLKCVSKVPKDKDTFVKHLRASLTVRPQNVAIVNN